MDRLIHLSLLFEVPVKELAGDQAGLCDLQENADPEREAEQQRKDSLLLFLKLLAVGMVIFLGVLINMVWFRFMNRFVG